MSSPGLQGLRPWIVQRVSAVYIAVFVVYFVAVFLLNRPFDFSQWLSWVAAPYNNVAVGLFLIAILWHAWIGVRDIVLDYVPNVVGRLLVLTLVACVVLGSGLLGFKALFLAVIH